MQQNLKKDILDFLKEVKPLVKDAKLDKKLDNLKDHVKQDYEYFEISSLHRDDLLLFGVVDETTLTDEVMENIARKLADDHFGSYEDNILKQVAIDEGIVFWDCLINRLLKFLELIPLYFIGDEADIILCHYGLDYFKGFSKYWDNRFHYFDVDEYEDRFDFIFRMYENYDEEKDLQEIKKIKAQLDMFIKNNKK